MIWKPTQPQRSRPKSLRSASVDDINLTALSSTAVYAEVWNMMAVPESYIRKTVKMKGVIRGL